MKKILTICFAGIILCSGSYYIFENYVGGPTFVKVRSMEIKNVYRDCTLNSNGNYRDTTIQTTIDVDVKTTKKYSLPISDGRGCSLRIGPNNIEGFSLNTIPPPEPYVQGIISSGLHMVTGGELRGDTSDILTFCCQEHCVVENLNVCENAHIFQRGLNVDL
ncbi:TPA: hypothetical protein DE059_00780 [Candidatus Peribacteria bacterium]|jgi:hypothetical protein|nr:hypothetical protein [Candidatus Peribacteria bacterium]